MIYSPNYFTIVYRDLTLDERRQACHFADKFSAGSWSHAIDDVSDLLFALQQAEAALSGVEPTDKVAETLTHVRKLLRRHQCAVSVPDTEDEN